MQTNSKVKIGETFRIVNSIAYKPTERFTVSRIDEDGSVITLNRHGDTHIFPLGLDYDIEKIMTAGGVYA